MNNDLTHEEIERAKHLLGLRLGPDFVTHTLVMGRQVGLNNDIRAQVDTIIEEEEEAEV